MPRRSEKGKLFVRFTGKTAEAAEAPPAGLSIGTNYEVVTLEEGEYWVRDDRGQTEKYPATLFEIVDSLAWRNERAYVERSFPAVVRRYLRAWWNRDLHELLLALQGLRAHRDSTWATQMVAGKLLHRTANKCPGFLAAVQLHVDYLNGLGRYHDAARLARVALRRAAECAEWDIVLSAPHFAVGQHVAVNRETIQATLPGCEALLHFALGHAELMRGNSNVSIESWKTYIELSGDHRKSALEPIYWTLFLARAKGITGVVEDVERALETYGLPATPTVSEAAALFGPGEA